MSVFDSLTVVHGWNIAQVALVAVHASFVLRHPSPTPAQLVLVPTHALLAVLLSPGLLAAPTCCSNCGAKTASASHSLPHAPLPSPAQSPSPSTSSLSPPSLSAPPASLSPHTPAPTPPRTPQKRRPPSTPPMPTTDTGWRPTVTPKPYARRRRQPPPPSPLRTPSRAPRKPRAPPVLPVLDIIFPSLLPHLSYSALLALRAVSKRHRAAVDKYFHRALQLSHNGTRAVGRSLSPQTWGRMVPRLALPRSLSLPSPVRALHVVNGAAPLRVLRGLEVLRVGTVQHVTHPAPCTVVMAPPVVAGAEWALAPRYEWPVLGEGVHRLVSTVLYEHAALVGSEDAPHTLLPPHVTEVVLHICRASPLAELTRILPPPDALPLPTDLLPGPSSSILVVRRLHGRGPRHILRLAPSVRRPRSRHGTIASVLADEPAFDGQPKLLDEWARAIARNLPERVFTLVGAEDWHPLWLAAGLSEADAEGATRASACSLRLRLVAEVARQARAIHDWSMTQTALVVEEGMRFESKDAYRERVGDEQFELETRW